MVAIGDPYAVTLEEVGAAMAFDDRCRPTTTIATLHTMIDRKPNHCSASPLPSPQ
jgi:hypothetical protein